MIARSRRALQSSHPAMSVTRYLMTCSVLGIAVSAAWPTRLDAQAPLLAEFEVVSIKRNPADADAASMRTLPDGTFVMINQTIRSIIMAAAPTPVRDVTGLPGWTSTERYDIIAKPPAGATPEQRSEMFRRMFEDRMQLEAHVEEREQTAFGLVVDRSDGRLGPQMSASPLDCTGSVPQVQPPSMADAKNRCGLSATTGVIVSGGTTIEALVRVATGPAGGTVYDRTGLKGTYALTLRYAVRTADASAGGLYDAPEFATALREQLGLRLRPERTKVPTLVVDSISRPTEN